MRQFTRFTLSVFLLLIFTAGTCPAVTVPGHDGTKLALSQIPDIIRHVTGQTSGDLRFDKDSLFVYGTYPGNNSHREIYSFNTDGSSNHVATWSDGTSEYVSTSDYQSVAALSTSAVRSSDKGKLQLNFFAARDDGKLVDQAAYVVSNPDSSKTDIQDGYFYAVGGNADPLKGTLVDVKGGMTVKGYDREVTAFLLRNGETINVYLGDVDTNDYGNDVYADRAVSGSWSGKTGNSDNVPKMLDGTVYFPVSMAVGDFDGDGYKNEIVVVFTNRVTVRYVVLQVTHTTDAPDYSSFTVSTLNNGDVDSYNYNNDNRWDTRYADRYLNMDGISCTYSLCTVAGDFDGDGKDEFAIVWRDTSPDNDRFKLPPTDPSLFCGYTGKIHLRTYKWNGSGFQTEEDVRVFDILGGRSDNDNRWNDIDLPLGVKAAVGDFDGDGRDDIAVLRVMLQYTEHYIYDHSSQHIGFEYSNFVFGAFVDWYTFDTNSIKPVYHGHSDGSNPWNYGDNKNGWVGIRTTNIGMGTDDIYDDDLSKVRQIYYLQPITGAQTPYPVIDREFDLIAGKFTGTIGTVTTRDDLIIKYPQWTDGDGNKIRSHVALMTNVRGANHWGTEVHEVFALDDRDHLLAFAKADYAEESVTLGDPVKTVDRSDLDYTAILQMMPYHVDNIKPDGSALTDKLQNFTLRDKTSITYSNATSSSEKKSMEYKMTSTAETIFALDSGLTRGASSTFQGVRGITSTFLSETPAGKDIESIGKIWDKIKDTTETTTKTSNASESANMMTITTQANYMDTLYVNKSDRYIWRYPLDNPPEWILDQTLSSYGSFDAAKANRKQTYITFAMSDAAIPTAVKETNDSNYQPYHEPGNLFSYPSALEQVEGYEGHKPLLSGGDKAKRGWEGGELNVKLDFVNTNTTQESTQKTNKAGLITKFLSVVDNIFGSNFAHIPHDTLSSFTRNVTDKENLTVFIPTALSGAQFNAEFEPYLDVTGATVVAFAVTSFRTLDALWGDDSLYSKKPDPSFLLPEKFNYVLGEKNNYAQFEVNDHDPTALMGRGIRYTVADHDIETNSLLVNGLKYKIRIPVYNASFVPAKPFKVRLSYSKELKYNTQKTTIAEVTLSDLGGQGHGNHRQYAEFEWTPNIDQGIYYLYAEIDPDHEIDEVHEDRRDASGNIIDCGGNNMAYFKIGLTNTDQVPFDRTELESQYTKATSAGKFAAADLDPEDFPYVEWVKVNGMDFKDFIEQEVDGQIQPVPAEVEVKYGGEYLMTDAVLIGYALKAESASKDVSEISDSDIGLVFVKKHFAMIPEEDHKIHFRIDPSDLENGVGFLLQVYGQEYPLTDIIYGSAGSGSSGVGSSSSGGCSAGLGVMAGVVALGLALMKRR